MREGPTKTMRQLRSQSGSWAADSSEAWGRKRRREKRADGSRWAESDKHRASKGEDSATGSNKRRRMGRTAMVRFRRCVAVSRKSRLPLCATATDPKPVPSQGVSQASVRRLTAVRQFPLAQVHSPKRESLLIVGVTPAIQPQ